MAKEGKTLSDLDIINLYEKTSKKIDKEFIEKVESVVNVKQDKKKTIVDTEWIEMIESILPYIDKIFRNPNRFIMNEEEIMKIEQTKKVTVESIKHLSKNTNFIQTIDEKTGDVTPSKLLNVRKEETYDTYENRLIYTLVQNVKFFVKRRKDAIVAMLDENSNSQKNDKLVEYTANTKVKDEKIDVKMTLVSTLENGQNDIKKELEEILERIEMLSKKINDLNYIEVYKILDNLKPPAVREPIKKTNVVKKNVNFQYAMKLWEYLKENYDIENEIINDNKDYEDEGELKKLVDETFLLQYLALKTLDEDNLEGQDTKEELELKMIEQMVDNVLDIDVEFSEEDLQQVILRKYEKIKYKKLEAIQEIQKIIRKNIDKYLQKIEG